MVNKRRPQKRNNTSDAPREYRINDQITSPEVRLVTEGVPSRVCSLQEALTTAASRGLDLVEINGTSAPVVCKIIDYSKFKYEQKRAKDKAKTKNNVIKEITITPAIGEHDIAVKQRHAITFLQKGFNVKVILTFPGRTIMFKNKTEGLLENFVDAMSEYYKTEKEYKEEGKQISCILFPKQK